MVKLSIDMNGIATAVANQYPKQHAGYAEKVPPNYLDTAPSWHKYLQSGPGDVSNSIQTTNAGEDMMQADYTEPRLSGIGGVGNTDIRRSVTPGHAYRVNDGYGSTFSTGAPRQPMQYGDRRPGPATPTPPRGTGMGALKR